VFRPDQAAAGRRSYAVPAVIPFLNMEVRQIPPENSQIRQRRGAAGRPQEEHIESPANSVYK
jgi:hypothetical protein